MKKILIVEDHADIRRLIRMTLEFSDFEIFEAPDGDTGLAMTLELAPELVLLDVMMPGALNGLDACRAMKALPKPPRVVMLTARGRSDDMEEGRKAGANAYMVKPFSPLQLMENVNAQMELA
jgi:DNA-binding response OmpR family regulator